MRADGLQRLWFQRRPRPALWFLAWFLCWLVLWPLHLLFVLGSAGRRRWAARRYLPVPVVVVGNLIVGGAGKTPLTLALAEQLRARGWRPGIISRGYGADLGTAVRAVTADSLPQEVGDEPCLLARRSACPLWVGRDRVAAGRALLAAHPEVNVLLCDDGLQHYRLARDVEIAVFDARGAGNGWRLPLGPLREPLARLARVDAVVGNGCAVDALAAGRPAFTMTLQTDGFYRLGSPQQRCPAAELVTRLAGKNVHAIAGIGHPERFFATLRALGLQFEAHAFADHQPYQLADLAFGPQAVLLMTEKDAVKCAALPLSEAVAEAWVLPVTAQLPPALMDLIVEKLRGCSSA